MNTKPSISSFVIRCHKISDDMLSDENKWRIKITHVQDSKEIAVHSMEEAMQFMKKVLGE
ncbi:hypothetical protein [Pseudalkalibacillus caeni]|uniref:Uncharacterized protein n=1 Tax=Exobacillus caeni TaxID=2574798 RepID=A0A5R9F7N8_9BACL|nr:hypothetical protein [Pseudalkalibacillus caeni]TLS38270.1 hypothetical protein FCL54_07000 [Pseudalkalibacillus caeni]